MYVVKLFTGRRFTDEDNIIDPRMPQERESPLRHTGRRLAGEIETIKRETGAIKQQVEELGEKEHVDKVTELRDALISAAEAKAAIREKLKNERDTLRHETETRRAQSEENGKLEDQLNTPILKCKDITEDREDLLQRAQIEAADDTLTKVRDKLKLEKQTLLEVHRTCDFLEDQLNFARKEEDNIAKEKVSVKLQSRGIKTHETANRKATKSIIVELEHLHAQTMRF
jgi:chromosome segregation ATPase